jgi:hypothetical protein
MDVPADATETPIPQNWSLASDNQAKTKLGIVIDKWEIWERQ